MLILHFFLYYVLTSSGLLALPEQKQEEQAAALHLSCQHSSVSKVLLPVRNQWQHGGAVKSTAYMGVAYSTNMKERSLISTQVPNTPVRTDP